MPIAEAEPTFPAARAAVVPRGRVVGETSETLPIETHVRALLRSAQIVAIVGPPGGGKSVALAHLAAAFAGEAIDFYDAPVDLFAVTLTGRPSIIAADEPPLRLPPNASVELAPWGEAERIDYLLARHPQRIRAVMEQLKSCDVVDALEGSPRLWTLVLDAMAERGLAGDRVEAFLGDLMASTLDGLPPGAGETLRAWLVTNARSSLRHVPSDLPPLLRRKFFARLALVDAIAWSVGFRVPSDAWQALSDPDLIRAVARRLRDIAGAREQLAARVEANESLPAQLAAMPAMVGVLLALDPEYRPPSTVEWLERVYAPRARWAGIQLRDTSLGGARLNNAELAGASLYHCIARHADFSGADLRGANLIGVKLFGATLVEASLASANLRDARLRDVRATAADFNGADLALAELNGADLSGASLRGAKLTFAFLTNALLAATDFTGAQLDGSHCKDVDFRDAILDGVLAKLGDFAGCRFDGMAIRGIDFTDARLDGADLTGSTLRNATLAGARLVEAGLADVDWEGCDLRNADFTRAAFHMGSSRSGMLDSPIACEGSRTGFYTHDDGLPHFQPPEQIRKANLCGCDLRGARVTGTDWYLVDLRGARYDEPQAAWFRKCGAILADAP